jgi:lambda family phage portal protein
MGLFSTIGAWWGNGVPQNACPRGNDFQGTKWRGASHTLRSLQNWFATIGSGTSDFPVIELRVLRARSRDAMRNHMIARAALTRCRTNIVGSGLMCRPSIDHKTLGMTPEEAETINSQLAAMWEGWAEDPNECDWESTLDFYGLQALALLSAMASGDVFINTPQVLRAGGVSELKMQLIEADRVSNPFDAVDIITRIDGVELVNGGPIGYWIRNTHPGDWLWTTVMPFWSFYDAFGSETGRRRVLHIWNDKERPGQVRGAPYLAPILEPLKQIERYGSAELMAAVLSAMLTVFIEKDNEQSDENGSPLPAFAGADASGNVALGNGAVIDLAPGEKANAVDPKRPNANFDPFFTSVCKQMGAALELPLDELLLHYQSSYSAARAAMLQAWRFYITRRGTLTQQMCQPVYGLRVDEEVASGRIALPGYGDPIRRRAFTRALWIGPARGAMDELKEAQAAGMRIAIGVSNESMECAAMVGEDWQAVHAQRVREVNQRKADGTFTPLVPGNLTFKDPPVNEDAPSDPQSVPKKGAA